MANSLVKSPSKAVKSLTSRVSDHVADIERARQMFNAAIRRAESDYFDRIKRITDRAMGVNDPILDDVEIKAPPPPVSGPSC